MGRYDAVTKWSFRSQGVGGLRTKLILVCLAAVASTLVAVSANAATGGASWQMNETSGSMQDSSGNGNHGNVNNVTRTGSTYGFNNTSSYVSVPSSSSLNPGSADITMTARVDPTALPPTDSDDIVRKGLSSTSGGDFKMEILANGKLQCLFRGSSGQVSVRGPSNQPNLVSSGFHTLRCVKTSSGVTASVDGVSNTNSGSVGSISNSAAVFVGAKNPGEDVFNGVMDFVTLEYAGGGVDPSPTPTPTPSPPPTTSQKCFSQPATIVGTNRSETLNGTEGPDVIVGLGGGDTISGLGGDDRICGNGGGDNLQAGSGNDRSNGSSGADTLVDVDGTDILQSGGGNDSLDAGDGTGGDTVNGGADSDQCNADDTDRVTNCETQTMTLVMRRGT